MKPFWYQYFGIVGKGQRGVKSLLANVQHGGFVGWCTEPFKDANIDPKLHKSILSFKRAEVLRGRFAIQPHTCWPGHFLWDTHLKTTKNVPMTKYVSFIRVFPCQSADRNFTDVTLVVSDDNCGDDKYDEDGEDDQDDQD